MPPKKPARKSTAIVPATPVERLIYLVRGQRIILDSDLAFLYGVSTKALNQQVRRNADRFPPDFMFLLTWEEAQSLRSQIATLDPQNVTQVTQKQEVMSDCSRSQIVTLNPPVETVGNLRSQFVTSSWGGRRNPPFAFTEHGAIMAATVLKSRQAVQVSLLVIRAFVKLREFVSTQRDHAVRLDEHDRILQIHDGRINNILDAFQSQVDEPPIGFQTELQGSRSARRLRAVTKGK